MRGNRVRQVVLIVTGLAAGTVTTGHAQIVRGQVVDSLTELPIEGAVVTLLDAPGTELARTTTDPEGLFLLRAPRGGSFYLRVVGMGYTESEFPEFLLAAEQMRGFMLLMGAADADLAPAAPVSQTPVPAPPPEVTPFITRVCGEGVVDPGQSVLIGQVTDAQTGDPVPNAEVVLLWSAVPEDLETHVGYQPSTGSAVAGAAGHFAVCGAPVDTRVVVHAQSLGRYSEFVSLRFADRGAFVNGEFRAMPEQLLEYDLEVLSAPLRTATAVGLVGDSLGARIESARVTIDGTTIEARTNLLGAFELTNLPPGTLRYTVEQIGYRPRRGLMEVTAGDTLRLAQTILLGRAAVALAPLNVEAERPERRRPLVDFERRRTTTNGQFMTREEWERQGTIDETVDVLRRMRGLRIRSGLNNWIITSARGARGLSGGLQGGDCYPIVFLDRIYLGNTQTVNLDRAVPIQNLEAVEYYNATAGLPSEFNRAGAVCGVIAMWTR